MVVGVAVLVLALELLEHRARRVVALVITNLVLRDLTGVVRVRLAVGVSVRLAVAVVALACRGTALTVLGLGLVVADGTLPS